MLECCVCIEISEDQFSPDILPAVTMIDSMLFCYSHAKDYIKVRGERNAQQASEMAAMMQTIAALKTEL